MKKKYLVKAGCKIAGIYYSVFALFMILNFLCGLLIGTFKEPFGSLKWGNILNIAVYLTAGAVLLLISFSIKKSSKASDSFSEIRHVLTDIEYTISGIVIVSGSLVAVMPRVFEIHQLASIIAEFKGNSDIGQPSINDYYSGIIKYDVIGVIFLIIQLVIGLVLVFRGSSVMKSIKLFYKTSINEASDETIVRDLKDDF